MIGKSSLALLLFCTSLAYGCSDRHQAPTPEDVEAISLELHQVVDGLDVPVGVASAGDGSGRLFILEKAGVIRIVDGGALVERSFLDIFRASERSRYGAGTAGTGFSSRLL